MCKEINFVCEPGLRNGGFWQGCKNKPVPKSAFCKGCSSFLARRPPIDASNQTTTNSSDYTALDPSIGNFEYAEVAEEGVLL
jgi:hypothetical protein